MFIMPKTKAQKVEIVERGAEEIKKAATLVFADFGGVSSEELKRLRRALRESGSKFTVVKKRLLRVIFEKLGIGANVGEFKSQLGTVLSPREIPEIAGVIYKFSRETLGADKKERFQILGGYDMGGKRFMESQEVKMIGQLPPREVLLGQLLGTIAGPMRAFLYVLDQKSKKV